MCGVRCLVIKSLDSSELDNLDHGRNEIYGVMADVRASQHGFSFLLIKMWASLFELYLMEYSKASMLELTVELHMKVEKVCILFVELLHIYILHFS